MMILTTVDLGGSSSVKIDERSDSEASPKSFDIPFQWQIQDFPKGGHKLSRVAPDYYLAIFSPENCMKMKEIGPRGGARVPPRSANILHTKFLGLSLCCPKLGYFFFQTETFNLKIQKCQIF